MGSQGGEDSQQGSNWAGGWVRQQLADWVRWRLVGGAVVPHLQADKLGGTTGEQDRLHNPEFQRGNKASKPLTEKICGC